MSNDNNTDIKDCCGAFAEIGSIIHPDDTELSFPISFDSQLAVDEKRSELEAYVEEQFDEAVTINFTAQDEHTYLVTLSFTCTAEKMIFEMNLRHLLA
ncbi:hypothetical protein PE36_02799 [Moritella sp. PE36]|uniref:DUF406 family protein n=1 Tax=Moritella sp. PE36 TaxID=58051 RepID=UPI0001568DCD|nr:DUF406 family protein [Moritella sp. PE36]EDM65665.1 hypothetical protein PE36_02799 [Moritella sp. PE36]